MSKIPKEVKDGIRKNLLAGASIRDTADSFDVSVSTVQRIKKEMPDSLTKSDISPSATDNSTPYFTKSEEEIAKKLKKEAFLFEDSEEGWVFHCSRSDYILKTSGRWWIGIAYPESVPDDWLERLKRTGLEVAISPLHDRDFWSHDNPRKVNPETGEIIEKGELYKAGDKKKEHWHFIVKSEHQISAREINNLIRPMLNCPYLQKCRSLKNYYEYFTHMNDPEKFQFYDKKDIIKMNDFHLEPNSFEKGQIYQEVLKECKVKEWETFNDFLDAYIDSVEVLMVINGKPASLFRALNENKIKHHPDEGNLTNKKFDATMHELINAIQEDRTDGKNKH